MIIQTSLANMGFSYFSDTGLIHQNAVKSEKVPILIAVGFGVKLMCTGTSSYTLNFA